MSELLALSWWHSEDGVLLEEVSHWGWLWGFMAWPHFLFFLSASCMLMKYDLSAPGLPGWPHTPAVMMPLWP